MTTFNIFHTTRVRIGVRDAPHIWGAGEIRDAGERRLFGGLARSEPFVTPHVWGTGEMSTEISAPYLGRWGNKPWKSRRIYVALGHDELTRPHQRQSCMSGQALLHHWLCNQKHPWGICSCSPIVNFLKVTFYHEMVSLVIFLIKKSSK